MSFPSRATASEPHIPRILFRVIHSGTLGFDVDGDLLPRDPRAPISIKLLADHLLWRRINTPYVSLCNYNKACSMIKHYLNNGAQDVRLIAFDTSMLRERMHSAHDLVWTDRNNFRTIDWQQLVHKYHRGYFQGEYLLRGAYIADSYRLLIHFHVVAVWGRDGRLGWTLSDSKEELEAITRQRVSDDIYSHTGRHNYDLRQGILATGLERQLGGQLGSL